MALKGLDIFKLSPKKNCKECGCPTCMAFSMKVAQGAVDIAACPYFAPEALAKLSAATEPPMKTIKVGAGDAELSLGGETVLFRHEKTFVSRTRYAMSLCTCMDDETVAQKLEDIKKVDYERIGERMFVEMVYVNYSADGKQDYVELVKKAAETGRILILDCKDAEIAKAALEVCKDGKPILNGADASNYEAMNALAKEADVVLGVSGANLDEIYDTVAALEKASGRLVKYLVLYTTANNLSDVKDDCIIIDMEKYPTFEEYENGYYKGHTTNYMVVKVKEKEQDGFIDNIKDIEIIGNDTQTEELIGK